ncbi:MAG TPA: hypothetical protein PLM00_06310 [Spirochaetota bacterium]|nr:hypothetical protein [Spirochaetota bacterium]HPH02614.1 hypothetical protein [Spirochaetota bacterium]HPN82986.1 hypothetical protein [Spirochaetota bacterium]
MRFQISILFIGVGLLVIGACSSSKEAVRPDGGADSSSSATSSTASTARTPAVVTVNNPVFVRDVWSNVRDISAANRSFLTGGSTAVAGVRSYKMSDAQVKEQAIPRAELEKSVGELRKILADPALGAVDRARCQYYLGACLIQLGDVNNGKRALNEAVRLDRNGRWGRMAAVELSK